MTRAELVSYFGQQVAAALLALAGCDCAQCVKKVEKVYLALAEKLELYPCA